MKPPDPNATFRRRSIAARKGPAHRNSEPMSLDREDVRKIAFLARIRVDEAELAPLAGELNNIIGWVESLAEVDTDGVQPMTSVAEMTLRRRDDVVDDGGDAEAVLANAPDRVDDYYAVPKVVE